MSSSTSSCSSRRQLPPWLFGFPCRPQSAAGTWERGCCLLREPLLGAAARPAPLAIRSCCKPSGTMAVVG